MCSSFAPCVCKKDANNKHKLVIDPAAAIVRDVFRWFVRGGIVAELARAIHIREGGGVEMEVNIGDQWKGFAGK